MNARKLINKISLSVLVAACLSSCTLDEYNPSGFTLEKLSSSSVEGYKKLLNNCYFGMERQLYGYNQWMMFCEGGTDIWTNAKNSPTSNVNYFKWGGIGNIPTNTLANVWNVCYDGIGYCNLAIKYADMAPFKSEEERNSLVAQAHFLRAMYYYNLVEQFGSVTAPTEPLATVNTRPEKVAPLDIYKNVIIPDLEFAAQWLPTTAVITIPSKKSAMGFLARAYLQTVEYDNSKEYASKALDVAKAMIEDCESGGAKYNTFMYPTFEEVFQESNNQQNKEALWAHRFVVGGVSNNAWAMNMNNELFYASVADFGGAMKFNAQDYTTWGRRSGGAFMPSHHLLTLFAQDDGSLDPRYHKSFQTTWTSNRPSFTWAESTLRTYDRSNAVTAGDGLVEGDVSIDFVHINDPDYAAKTATKLDQKYLVVDHADVYDLALKTVKMTYTRVNREPSTVPNPFFGFYPSLIKHNSSNYYVNNANSNRYGNLNATFMMRMAEVYLIAAEADIYANGGVNAITYINKIRLRAGANPLTSTATVQTVLDERARELCGEYVRYYDLKRTKKLNKTYLMETNPDVGQSFRDGINEVKPIPSSFLSTLQEGGAYYQNNGY